MISADIPLHHRTLRAVFESALDRVPERLALRDGQRALTYSEAWHAALSMAGGFEALGVARGDYVLLMLDNHVDNAECWLALALSGRVEIPINTAYKGDLLRHIIRDSGARVLVLDEAYMRPLLELGRETSLHHVVVRRSGVLGDDAYEAELARLSAYYQVSAFGALREAQTVAPAELAPWDLMSVSFTSGTSGRSKGVLCPHAHAFGHATTPGLGDTQEGETRFIVLPQFHIAGRWGGIYNAIAHRGCAFIADRFRASTFWDEARAAGAATSQLVGAMATFLERQPPRESDRGHGLREIALIPLTREPLRWAERFGVKLTTSYGSTEAGSVINTTVVAGQSCGTARNGYSLRIVDEHDIEVADGQPGELLVRPDLPWTSATGYVNAPEPTARAWRNGWFHTGDALVRDSEGNYAFVDRVDDAIRRRGENISTGEVEYLILQHPAVAQVAVVGIASEYLEDEVKAVIILEPGHDVSEAELAAQLAKTMPYFMVPRFISFVSELPMTPTGKIRKAILREQGRTGCWDGEAGGPRRRRKASAAG